MKTARCLMSCCLMLILAALCLLVLPTEADAATTVANGSCNSSVYWRLDSEGQLTVYGNGAIPNYDYNYSRTPPWYQYEDSIVSIVVQKGITAIGDDAFSGMPYVTSISLPDTLVQIGETAIMSCNRLTELTIPDSVTTLDLCAFQYCENLKSVTLGSGIKEIPYATFRSCKSLTNVTIPDSVTTIDLSAFDGCEQLQSIYIPASVINIPNNPFLNCKSLKNIVVDENNPQYTVDSQGALYELYQGDLYELLALPGAFQGEYVIPDGVSRIGGNACEGCSGLTGISIPDSVSNIWVNAFKGCTGLTSVVLPDGISKINDYTFSGCYNLTSIEIPSSVSSVGNYVFSSCRKLKTLRFGSMSSIGQYAFQGMSAEIYYPTNDASWTDSLKQSYGGVSITYVPYGNDWSWNLDAEGTLTITGTGPMNPYSIAKAVPWYSQKDSVKKVVIGDGITRIGARAFYECSNLTQITIPESVTAIERYAFYNCKVLTEISIPESVTELGRYAFGYCESLQSIALPDSITEIEDHTFYSCTVLSSVKFPASLRSVGSGAFLDCDNLTSVLLPDSVTVIENSAFSSCDSLSDLTLSNSLEKIGQQAFYYCQKLTKVQLPDSLKSIGQNAFSYCEGLTQIKIPAGVNDIAPAAFSNCSKLTAFEVEPSNAYYTNDSSGVLYTKDMKILHTCPIPFTGTYVIPQGVREISAYAFDNCRNLSSIEIPDSVVEIGTYAFRNCRKLNRVVLPDSVTSLGSGAFYYCSSLEYVTLGRICEIKDNTFGRCGLRGVIIPDSVTSINGFYSCSLVSIVIPSSVTNIASGAFDSNSSLSHVLYLGTVSEKAKMTIGTTGNTYLTNAKWCYSAKGKITERSDCVNLYYDCSVCGKTYSKAKINDSHSWIEATCITPKYCSICETTSGEPLGHSFTQATCTTAKTCTTCGVVEGEPLGHSGETWIELIAPTCTTDGLKARICEICKATETVTVKALGHQGEKVITPPTCTEQGYTTVTCDVCGVTDNVDFVPALGHTMEQVVTAPTCTEQGYTTNTCTVCGHVSTSDYVDALGHNWSDWVQTSASTCAQEGEEIRFCNCGAKETQPVEKLPHTCESVVTAPTCTEQGYTTYTCTVCGDVSVADYVDANGHSWSEWIQISAPSCETEGSRIHFCNCGVRETESIAKLPHSYADGVCTVCNSVMSGYAFLTADMTLTGLELTEDLYIDLNGFDLSGTIITNGFAVYGMDSTTDEYSFANIGTFSCVDENGQAIVPVRQFASDITGTSKRYIAIEGENGYSFHRFFLGVTHMSLKPTVDGVGYKALFCGDDMVAGELESYGYSLWFDGYQKATGSKNADSFVSGKTVTLRINNFDAENFGEKALYAAVTMTLKDGTIIESSEYTMTLRGLVEEINENASSLTQTQLQAIAAMIKKFAVMQSWKVENLYN